MPVRVLVVEDEVKMAGLLRRGLEEEGFAVDGDADNAATTELAVKLRELATGLAARP